MRFQTKYRDEFNLHAEYTVRLEGWEQGEGNILAGTQGSEFTLG